MGTTLERQQIGVALARALRCRLSSTFLDTEAREHDYRTIVAYSARHESILDYAGASRAL